jgi:hypothetical protein
MAFWSGASALSSNANFTWDDTNRQLGIGLSPTDGEKLLVYGDALGGIAGNTSLLSYQRALTSNSVGLKTQLYRTSAGATWSTAAIVLQRQTDATPQAFLSMFGDNIGVGDYTPAQRLTVGVSEVANIPNAMLGVYNATGSYGIFRTTTTDIETLIGSDAGGGIVGTMTAHTFAVRTSNTDRLSITSAGAANFTGTLTVGSSNVLTEASGNVITGQKQFQSNLGGFSGSLNTPSLQAYATGGNSAFMSFHRSAAYAVNMGLDSDNVLRIGGWSAAANRWQLDMSGNETLAGNVTAAGAVYASNWFRSYGTSGWYNETHQGGIYMEDSTYVRVYNNKLFYSSNEVRVGSNIRTTTDVTAANNFYFGNAAGVSSTGVCRSGITGADPWLGFGVYGIGFCVSLGKYKDNQQNLSIGLDELRQLRAKEFDWNINNNGHDLGFIAEEVEAVSPLLTEYAEGKLSGVKYNQMSALIVNAVQELDVQVQANDTRLDVVEAGIFSGNLSVAGSAQINGNLKVQGTTQLASLKVTGLTEVADLKVDRIISKGNVPTAVLGVTTTGQGSTYVIEGNDTAGTITFTTGSSTILNPLASGEQVSITFDKPFTTVPRIAITAVNGEALDMPVFAEKTVTGFKLITNQAPLENTTYQYDYIVIQ